MAFSGLSLIDSNAILYQVPLPVHMNEFVKYYLLKNIFFIYIKIPMNRHKSQVIWIRKKSFRRMHGFSQLPESDEVADILSYYKVLVKSHFGA